MTTTFLISVAVGLLSFEIGRLRGIRQAARVAAGSRETHRAAMASLDACLQSEAALDAFYANSDVEVQP